MSNPFLDDNPFLTRDQVVEVALREHRNFEQATPFGSPIPPASPASIASNATPMPPSSSSTNFFTPATRLTYPSSPASEAWSFNGTSPSRNESTISAFNTTAPSPSSKKSTSTFGRLFSTTPSSPSPTTTTPPRSSPASMVDLQRRESELQRREADLARRETSLAAAGAVQKNWPRYLRWVHHDINGDIPAARRGLVRAGYTAWCLVACGYVYNFICITAFFIGGQKKVSLWVFSGLVAVAGLPLSFLCWYRGLYFAAARDTAKRWAWYFLHMLAHIFWCWWMFVGVQPNLGGYSAGLFTMIDQFSDGGGRGVAFGVMSILNMAVFAVCGVLSMGILAKSWGVFRSGPPLPPDRVRI